jgi:23S rRNA (adenine2503-C2)-methyltransferase
MTTGSALPHILDLSSAELSDWLQEHNQPAFRLRQIIGWIYERRAESFDSMSDLPKTLRELLAQHFDLWVTQVAAHQQAEDGTEKLLVQLADGGRVECVLLRDVRQQSSWLCDGLCLLCERTRRR